MGNFKKFDRIENYNDDSKNASGSDISLILKPRKLIFNGSNTLTDQPKVGDIVVWDKNKSKKRFIACGTYNKRLFPSALSVLGVVYHIEGRKVYAVSYTHLTLPTNREV